jgi:hypothetical protein
MGYRSIRATRELKLREFGNTLGDSLQYRVTTKDSSGFKTLYVQKYYTYNND